MIEAAQPAYLMDAPDTNPPATRHSLRSSFLELSLKYPTLDGQSIIRRHLNGLPQPLKKELLDFAETQDFQYEFHDRLALQAVEEDACGGLTKAKLIQKVTEVLSNAERAANELDEDPAKQVNAYSKIANTYITLGEFAHGTIQNQNMRHSVASSLNPHQRNEIPAPRPLYDVNAQVVSLPPGIDPKSMSTDELKRLLNMPKEEIQRYVPQPDFSGTNIVDAEFWENL